MITIPRNSPGNSLKQTIKYLLPVFVAALCYVLVLPAHPVHAAGIIEVNSTADTTADDGECTLREAITAANIDTASGVTANECAAGSGVDTINFAISGSGVHTIQPSSNLPSITEQLTVNGYSQPGSAENNAVISEPIDGQITIQIDGTNIATDSIGLDIKANGTVVSGVAVYNFNASDSSIYGDIIVDSDNVSIYGVYAGVGADGQSKALSSQESGLVILPGSLNTVVGGNTPQKRNIFASTGNTAAVNVFGDSTSFFGNFINLSRSGVTELDSVIGLYMYQANEVVVGGNSAAKRNVISGAQIINVLNFGGNNCIIQGNYIGTDISGHINPAIINGHDPNITNAFLERGVGIALTTATNSLVGGVNSGEGNLIAGVHGIGVAVERLTVPAYIIDLIPDKNSILGNLIYNVGTAFYPGQGLGNSGIDIMGKSVDENFTNDTYNSIGPDANDTGDIDGGANGQINKPVISSAVQTDTGLKITYSLDAADSPSNTYRVEFYSSDDTDRFGIPFGKEYLGYATVSPGSNLILTLNTTTSQAGKLISATTTAVDATTNSGFGSTSEFSGSALVNASDTSPRLADTGESIISIELLATTLILSSVAFLGLKLRAPTGT